jgi:hypothetical protein
MDDASLPRQDRALVDDPDTLVGRVERREAGIP